MTIRRCLVGLVGLAMLASWGCNAPEETQESEIKTSKPHLLALSTYSASLGTPIDAFMSNPPPSDAQKIELWFDGTFKRRDGKEERVQITQPTSRTEAGAVRWTQFGPFANPFTPKSPDIGVFTGKVGVKVTLADGTEQMDEAPIPVQLEVKPSIIVTELQPTSASCERPAGKLIGGMTYKMKTEMIGFDAASVEYEIKTPGVVPDARGLPTLDVTPDGTPNYRSTLINHAVGAGAGKDGHSVDKVEANDGITLPMVPPDRPSYGVVFAIVARDAKGGTVRSTFGMTAHNPIEVFYDGRFQLAQIYPAEPVSSCMPGGQQGRAVSYTESKSETRSRELSVTLSKNWLQSDENNWSTTDGRTVTRSKTETEGYAKTTSTTNSFTFERNHSDTTGVSFNWSDTTEVKGEAKVGFKPFGIGAEVGGGMGKSWTKGGSRSSSSTDGWSQSTTNSTTDAETVSRETATTDSTSVTKSDTKGGSQTEANGGAQADQNVWTVSSADTIQKGFGGQVIASTYGVFYRQMARYTQKAFIFELDKCGEGQVIGDVTMQDYVWAPDLALGQACPPLPNSNFPAAQCYLPPCDPQ